MTQTIRPGNKLIKLIKFLTGKQTHKTHKLIREGCAIISTGKQTHKTHKTHGVSIGNKLIKLIKGGGVDETHEFLEASPRPDKGFACFTGRLNTQYEFYEFPPALTCEEKQYCRDLKHVHKGTAGKLIKLIKLIRLAGAV